MWEFTNIVQSCQFFCFVFSAGFAKMQTTIWILKHAKFGRNGLQQFQCFWPEWNNIGFAKMQTSIWILKCVKFGHNGLRQFQCSLPERNNLATWYSL